jgi:group I intron endonuclease
MPFIYSIKCKVAPFHEYIGQTTQNDFQVRLNGHISDVKNGRKRHLYNSIRKYGWGDFVIEILHEFPKTGNWEERLDELEIREIAERNTLAPNGYNNEAGGNRNKVLHEDTKALMSAVRSGERHSMFGKNHSAETCQAIREANTKPVQQWSKDGSELLRTFVSIDEAEFRVAGGGHITQVCNGKRKTAGGFHWKFVDEADMETKEVLKFTKIQQWSFDGSSLIREFDTICAAAQATGADRRVISKCCKGVGRSAGGFKWKVLI